MASLECKTLLVDEKDGVLTVSLNRPEVRNAFNAEMISDLHRLADWVEKREQVRMIFLQGRGKVFCAGGDLNWMKESLQWDQKTNYKDSMNLSQMLTKMNQCPKPVIGLIHGGTYGGGVGLISICDHVISTKDTIFSLSEVRLGLIPACIGPFVLDKVGPGHCRSLFISGERFLAEKALQIGLIHEVVEDQRELEGCKERLMKTFQNCGPKAIQTAKAFLQIVKHLDLSQANELASRTLADLRVGVEAQEGTRAFFRKAKTKMVAPNSKKILIANRGEVALRILHGAHELGLKTALIVSQKDQESLPANLSHENILLKGETLAETYLDAKQIIKVAKKHHCDLLHPGFGFLSEDSSFAKMVKEASITWVGPSPKSMEAVSDKVSSKKLCQKLKIPTSPWTLIQHKPSLKDLAHIKNHIGFPCLVKAVAGGGGKGLKRIEREKELEAGISSARREAKNAFDDDRVFVEKVLDDARHIEVQVFGDHQKKIHAFGERDCSMQRRYQKVIEESPAPGISELLRKKLETYAKKIAAQIHYQSAGTVEFLVHGKDLKPYFLEMNTRLQVEHGVTEERYGIDLVKMQILTALKKSIATLLPKGSPRGHVMELRLYAEDASMGFLPQPGPIYHFEFPRMKGLRVDSAIRSGDHIFNDYDPMIAKLILSGKDRNEVLEKSTYALQQTKILGPTTNRDFLIKILHHPEFRKGNFTTQFLQREKETLKGNGSNRELALAIAAALYRNKSKGINTPTELGPQSSIFSEINFGRDFL